eukprot:41848-Amphidinium_carterae.1
MKSRAPLHPRDEPLAESSRKRCGRSAKAVLKYTFVFVVAGSTVMCSFVVGMCYHWNSSYGQNNSWLPPDWQTHRQSTNGANK